MQVAKFIRKAYEVSGISLEGIPEYETPNTASSLQGAPQAASADDGITRDDSSITPDDIELVADGDGHGSLMVGDCRPCLSGLTSCMQYIDINVVKHHISPCLRFSSSSCVYHTSHSSPVQQLLHMQCHRTVC